METVNSELATIKSLSVMTFKMFSPRMPLMPPRESYFGAMCQLSARETSPTKLRVTGFFFSSAAWDSERDNSSCFGVSGRFLVTKIWTRTETAMRVTAKIRHVYNFRHVYDFWGFGDFLRCFIKKIIA